MSTAAAPHRELEASASPHGEDVRAVKRQTLVRLRARGYRGLPSDPDDTFGDRYADLAADALYALGAADATVDAARAGRLTVGAQRLISGQRRTAAQRARAVRRLPEVRRRARASKKPDVVPGGAPRIVNANLRCDGRFGALGALLGAVGHYTAGPRDTSLSHALALWRQYHAQHIRQGWGGIGYHLGIPATGELVLLRPVGQKGAHTAGANTGRIGIVVHGGPGQRMTDAQRATWRWLKENGHTAAMPASHRLSHKLSGLRIWGHNDLFATSCPGAFESDYKAA
ncbi:unannotated protein [freshwater metagenome]|uniref:Unannotated protein n=1 Tax=freshwater metagenome TaxID=449393 RepID=A0A6J7FSH3_9ZZZZ|nr:hypothetical protein [Actinomycetota bacterium]